MKKNNYKTSLYNIVVHQEKGFVYIWNTSSNAIVKLDEQVYNAISNNNFSEDSVQENSEGLLKQGIVVPKDINEFNQLLYEQKKFQLNNQEILFLTIAPTMECNFRCVYCFENDKPKGKMCPKTIEEIIQYVENHIRIYKIKRVVVRWFGGEPLMVYDVIRCLSEKFIQLCKVNNIEYNAHIITNGFYLNSDIIDSLINKDKVKSFQISFDGTEKNYCKYKNVTSKVYSQVKNNLFELLKLKKEDVKIKIRINVDKDNIGDVNAFVNELQNDERFVFENVTFSLGRIFGDCKKCLSFTEFEDVKEKCGFIDNNEIVPESRLVYCSQCLQNSVCIDFAGKLYKCEHDFGIKDRIVGDVINGLYYNDYYLGYVNQTVKDKCKKCRLYPICLGGCPNDNYNKKTFDCEFNEEQLIKKVKKYIERR